MPRPHRAAVACAAALVVGCGAPAATARHQTTTPAAEAADATPMSELDRALADAEAAWADRWDPSALARAERAWQRALTLPDADPTATQLRLAEAAHYRGNAILARGGTPGDARAAFEAGVAAAVEAGATDPKAEPSEAHYWWAENRAAAALQVDYAESVVAQADVLAVMQRCVEKKRTWGHWGAARFLGSHHARPLAFEHRELARARAHFDAAIAGDPKYLPTRIAFARDYAVAAQDRTLFEQQVRFVVESKPTPGAETGDVELAKAQAEALLRDAPNLFE